MANKTPITHRYFEVAIQQVLDTKWICVKALSYIMPTPQMVYDFVLQHPETWPDISDQDIVAGICAMQERPSGEYASALSHDYPVMGETRSDSEFDFGRTFDAVCASKTKYHIGDIIWVTGFHVRSSCDKITRNTPPTKARLEKHLTFRTPLSVDHAVPVLDETTGTYGAPIPLDTLYFCESEAQAIRTYKMLVDDAAKMAETRRQNAERMTAKLSNIQQNIKTI